MTVDDLIDGVLKREGGFVNHPSDKGGPTKFGITQATLADWRNQPVTAEDVRNLSEDEARDIYKFEYYHRPNIPKLPAAIQPQIFDMAVNLGPRRAIRLMQGTLTDLRGTDVIADGVIGPQTVGAAQSAIEDFGSETVNDRIADTRILFYRHIVERDPNQRVFLKGWLNRANQFKQV